MMSKGPTDFNRPAGADERKSPQADIGIRTLFGIAFSIVALGLLAALTRQRFVQSGLSVQGALSDIPLLLGLLILFYGNYNYYRQIIEPRGEEPNAALFSLFGMIAMIAVPIVLSVEAIKPMRYLVLTGYGVLVALKNYSLQRRFSGLESAMLFRRWCRRAVAQTSIGFVAGLSYYLLIDRESRDWLLARLVECSGGGFRAGYESSIDWVFNGAFLLMILWLYVSHHRDLYSRDLRDMG